MNDGNKLFYQPRHSHVVRVTGRFPTSTFFMSQGGWYKHVFRVKGRLGQPRISCHRAIGTTALMSKGGWDNHVFCVTGWLVQPRFSCHMAVGTTTLFRSQGGLVQRRCSVTGRFGITTLFRSEAGWYSSYNRQLKTSHLKMYPSNCQKEGLIISTN